MSNRITYLIAIALLIIMAALAITSMAGDSLTMDELAHLPAGYSYVARQDMRLNPEHPPLIKDLSALPLLFVKGVNFPSQANDWKDDVNGQWGFGNILMFKSGNPADRMIFLGRLPMVGVLLLLGFYVFKWSKEIFGPKAGLLALFIFSFSPTLLAHGRLVTTDVGAAAGAFIATYYFVKFLKDPLKRNLIFAGIALGLAELAKFSLILLVPCFGIILIGWAIAKASGFKNFFRVFFRYFGSCLLIGLVAFVLMYGVYFYHTLNYPPEKQVKDTQHILTSFSIRPLADLTAWMADKPLLRPIAQYMLGLFMILQRASGGNTGYFMGEMSASGWNNYFPIVYFLKETLAFHIISWLALLYTLWTLTAFWHKPVKRAFNWLRTRFPEFAMVCFIFIYWTTSLRSNLNIGVRHLLPIFPFTIALMAGSTILWLKKPLLKPKIILVGLLLAWQAASIILVYPHFLSYYNEIAGGPKNGYLYAVDSNYDWGQDLKRLKKWVDDNNIDKIYVDYFGGADTSYYLKQKYAQWQGTNKAEDFPKGNYLAVSATLLQGGRGKPVKGFEQASGYYLWLNDYEPVATIGYSIFVYKIP